MEMLEIIPMEEYTKEEIVAKEIIDRCMKNIKRKVYDFVFGLNLLKPVPVKDYIEICTDGENLFFNSSKIIQALRDKELAKIEQNIFHILMHGLLGHFEEKHRKDKRLFWAAMDIQVRRCMSLLYQNYYGYDEGEMSGFTYEQEEREFVGEELYFKGVENKEIRRKICSLGKRARMDNHNFWYFEKSLADIPENEDESGDDIEKEELKRRERVVKKWSAARKLLYSIESEAAGKENKNEAFMQWQIEKQYNRIRGEYGTQNGNNEFTVKTDRNSSNSYKQIMEEILKVCETVREEDEIDKALYQYGLEMYGDVPLVEPEEMSEKKQMRTFIIAVDTSGSCTERQVEFLREIIKIFDEIKEMTQIEHICYLECDTKIQREENYYNVSEFVRWGNKHTFRGGGGTAFEPVFEKADELIGKGETIDALFYLSDAEGSFPLEQPSYPVYFILDKEDVYNEIDMMSESDVRDYLDIPEWVNILLVDL